MTDPHKRKCYLCDKETTNELVCDECAPKARCDVLLPFGGTCEATKGHPGDHEGKGAKPPRHATVAGSA